MSSSQPPLVQQPTTPQYNMPQQLYPQLSNASDMPPSSIPSSATAITQQNQRRPQVARNLQYKDNSFDAVRQDSILPQQSGFTIDSFRLLSVLGRGHFGKVILSQYKKTGKLQSKPTTQSHN